VRWVVILSAWLASAGLVAVSITMNFAFGSSFGRTALESCAYGAAFGFADILKVAAPIVAAGTFAKRKWGATLLALLLWGTFTVCSAVSAIGYASANRTFTMDSRKVQAALNQSLLTSLEADQSELRRLRERLASPEVGRNERLQLTAAAQRLETAIGTNRGKLEDSAPIVTTPNPQAYTLAHLTGASMEKVETCLVLLVALLVELGGLGPFISMNLAKVPEEKKVLANSAPPPRTTIGRTFLNGTKAAAPAVVPAGPQLVRVDLSRNDVEKDLGRFLDGWTRRDEHSALSSTQLLARYNRCRREHGLEEISQRRLGDAMGVLGHRDKVRLSGGRTFYRGLAWSSDKIGVAAHIPDRVHKGKVGVGAGSEALMN
jgi:hypothetical protein